jgi:AraC-like DNA-binding protein
MAEDYRGILNPREGFRHFRLTLREPAADLRWCLERHWIVEWDLPESEPYPAQVLPAPTFHLVVEEDGTWLYGVGAARFERRISGRGRVVGTKFRPGGAHPLLGEPAWRYTDRSLRAGETLGAEVPERESVDDQVAATEAFLRARLPGPDATVARIGAVVATMEASPALSVQEVAARHGVSVRTLQRLFRRWVGVSPKWVLQRFRLQEAAERVDEAGADDAAATAVELGYYDQAHFINDFRAGVGRSPRRYARSS